MREDGFTLIEMIVVIAIIAIISVFAFPSLTSYFQLSLNGAAREVASTVKETFNQTSVTNRVFRIAYDLKKNEYWIEGGPEGVLLDTKVTKEKAERKKKFGFKQKTEDQPTFAMDKAISKKKKSLPRGVVFEDIITQQSPDPIKEGMVYTHFFPQGITEQTIIHLQDTAKHHSSLVISPLIGRTDLYNHYIDGKDVFGK